VRIAELSKTTGVAVATIKYYLREGLLPPGELTSPNQARYGAAHLSRLKLVRALVDVGGLSIAAVKDVLGALDDSEQPTFELLGVVQKAITKAEAVDAADPAHQVVKEFLTERGWWHSDENPAAQALARVLVTARELGHPKFAEKMLKPYADACERIATSDVAYVLDDLESEDLLEGVVVGTVLGDAAIVALRRLAQQVVSERRLGAAREG